MIDSMNFESTVRHEVYIDGRERAIIVCGESISLSENEYAIISLLLENRGRALNRAEISREIDCCARQVDVHIRYLRRKIDERLNLTLIRTVRGVGYVIM